MWKGTCFDLEPLSDAAFAAAVNKAPASKKTRKISGKGVDQTYVAIDFQWRPEFSIGSWGHLSNPPRNDGLEDNQCWPQSAAKDDPTFVLLRYDPYYAHMGKTPRWDYEKPYAKGTNGD